MTLFKKAQTEPIAAQRFHLRCSVVDPHSALRGVATECQLQRAVPQVMVRWWKLVADSITPSYGGTPHPLEAKNPLHLVILHYRHKLAQACGLRRARQSRLGWLAEAVPAAGAARRHRSPQQQRCRQAHQEEDMGVGTHARRGCGLHVGSEGPGVRRAAEGDDGAARKAFSHT
jgi:hypothetical protein